MINEHDEDFGEDFVLPQGFPDDDFDEDDSWDEVDDWEGDDWDDGDW